MSVLPFRDRPTVRTGLLLAVLAYVPAFTAAPGRMPADSKLYLYLDPGRFLVDAASTFDPRQFAGWVPHQHVAYLWPAGPWYRLFDLVGVPDWIAHRLWIGTILLAAGMGVRWSSRLLGLAPIGAAVAAVVYQLTPYVLPYVSRTSVMLLPWAGLGWIVAFTVRATHRRTWADPAAIALVVLTVGAVNATALAMIVPAPVLWLVHAAWRGEVAWRSAIVVAARTAVLSIGVSLWWITMLVVQARHGVDVLPYSEALADVSLTSTAPEVWRGLGYWLFYVRDVGVPTTAASLRYLSSSWTIAISFLVPILGLAGLVWTQWAHRRYALLLVATGAVLAVGVHPIDDRSPLMRLVGGEGDTGLALALRSSTRAVPLLALGLALGAGALVTAAPTWHWRRVGSRGVAAALVAAIAVVNLPALWTGEFVDPTIVRDQDPPDSWQAAAAVLDASGPDDLDAARVLQVPGVEFGAFGWGYTVDQPLPGLTDRPLVTRDLLPLGSPAAMDLLFALDDRIQDGVLEPASVAPIARLLGADTVWLTGDVDHSRFRTTRPEVVGAVLDRAPGLGAPDAFGNRPGPFGIERVDERSIADPRVAEGRAEVELYPVERPGSVVRAASSSVLVSASGDGLVDLAAAGLIDGRSTVLSSASVTGADLVAAIAAADAVLITDSNRDRARHWRSSQDTTGFTESGGPDQDVLRPTASDQRLAVFDRADADTETVALQRGAVAASASSYGEPFAYLPEHRPAAAIDGDQDTAWIVGEHGDPLGEVLRLDFDRVVESLRLLQVDAPGARRIETVALAAVTADGTAAEVVALDDRSTESHGQHVDLPAGTTAVELRIEAVTEGTPFTAGAVAGVGFREVAAVVDGAALAPTVEVVRPPHDALDEVTSEATPLALAFTRLRVDPADRWRDDPEPRLVREFDLPIERTLDVAVDVRIDGRADDERLARALGWPVWATSRLTGMIRAAGVAAVDGDPTTAWTTEFDGAVGATLHVAGVASPIDAITVTQGVADTSPITELRLRVGDQERTVVVPARGPSATVPIDPALPAGDLALEITAVETRTTIDRRHGDPVELPAAIAELGLEGFTPVAPLDAGLDIDCAPLLELDGRAIEVSVRLPAGGAWLDGAPLLATVCDRELTLASGSHLIRSVDGDLPLTVDRVVLADLPASAAADAADPAWAMVIGAGRFERRVAVTGCPDGCWLVLGEGHNDAWTATLDGDDLGAPALVDGGFNGWWLEPASGDGTVTVRWTAQRQLNIAFALTVLAALSAIALLALHRRPPPAPAGVSPPVLSGGRRLPIGAAVLGGALWALVAGVLVAPVWAVWGLVGGLIAFAVRRTRVAELTAWSTLVVVAALVVWIERREMPLPDGAWPSRFESLHGVAMFAIAAIAVAAILADDAGTTEDLEADDAARLPASP